MKAKIWPMTCVVVLVLLFIGALGLTLVTSGSQALAAQPPPLDVQVSSSTQDKQKGIAYVSWWHGQYASAASDESLVKLEETGAEWISLLVTWYQDTITSTEIISDANRTPTDADLTHAISTAHSLGLKVMLKPHLDLANDPTHWRGQIGEGFTETQWIEWFDSYQSFINYYAQMAQDNDVEQFCVGTELEGTVAEEMRWREVITGVSGVTSIYTGPLVYAANHTYTNTVMFWDALDYIGIDAYYVVASTNTATVEDIKLGWTEPISFLQELSDEWGKPIIFTEIGYRSVDGAGMAPWDYGPGFSLDLQEQADLYQAFFEVVFPQPWLEGVFLWSWDTNPMQGGQCDRGFTPLDKPAELVLRQYYGGEPKGGAGNLPPRPNELGAMYIYTDALAAGWWDGSWNATVYYTETAPVYTGQNSISVTVNNWGGITLGDGSFDTTPYQWLEFYLRKVNPLDEIRIFFWDNGTELPKIDDCRYTVSEIDGWAHVRIPLSALKADDKVLQRFSMQPYVNGGTSSFWIDQVRLLGVIPVELSDGQTKQAMPGQTVTYDHVLQNYHSTTDTLSVEVDPSHSWPLTLTVGGVSGSGPISVELAADMTTTVQIQLAVPLAQELGVTETTVVTATSVTQPQYFDTLTDVTEVRLFRLYLPLVLRSYSTP